MTDKTKAAEALYNAFGLPGKYADASPAAKEQCNRIAEDVITAMQTQPDAELRPCMFHGIMHKDGSSTSTCAPNCLGRNLPSAEELSDAPSEQGVVDISHIH